MMGMYELIQLIIAILSLIATISVSVVLYCFERKNERRVEEQNEKIRRLNLEHEADIFLIKNGDEIEYLPLCVFADSLNGTKKHLRDIYNNYNVCSNELKKIILEKQNIYIRDLPQENWSSIYIRKLVEEVKDRNLGRNLFYDDGKYIRDCYDYYRKYEIPIDTLEFVFPDYHIDGKQMVFRKNYRCSLYSYIARYFDYIKDICKYDNPQNIEVEAICDIVYKKIVGMDKEIYSYWCTMLMRFLCAQLRNEGCQYSLTQNPYGPVIEIEVESYEDLYYCALYELYLTFGKIA